MRQDGVHHIGKRAAHGICNADPQPVKYKSKYYPLR